MAEPSERSLRAQERWAAAAHAMQSGVRMEQERGSNDGSPKHLRVGVNTALTDHGSLVTLLIAKGIITEEEYMEAIADGMEAEQRGYEARLSAALGAKVTLA